MAASFEIVEIAVLFAAFIGALFLGRLSREKTGTFVPIVEPISLLYIIALSVAAISLYLCDLLTTIASALMIIAAAGYMLGYPLGDFSQKGIVELSFGKQEVKLDAYKVAYYYNHLLKKDCISDIPGMTFRQKCRRILLGIHDTADIPKDAQIRTTVSTDNRYFSLKISAAMTYVLKKEPKTFERRGKTIKYTHYRFIPADITEQGPYDFFVRTELYLAALDIADTANAQRIRADIECKKAAAEGGATIVQSIAKLDPADAAATLEELKEFVGSEEKTTVAAAAAADARPEPEEPKKRWWQVWRRKK